MSHFFTDTSDADLAKELLAGSCELYIQQHEYSGAAVLTLAGTAADYFTLADGGAAADDAYNSSQAQNFFVVDDNSALCTGKITDVIHATAGSKAYVQVTALLKVSDGVTPGTFTDAASYTVLVLTGSNANEFGDYFGYTDDSVELDTAIETDPLVIVNIDGQEEEVAEKVKKRNLSIKGATYNVPNVDVLSKVMAMVATGVQSATHKEYHGGFSPNITTFFQMTALTKDWDGNYIAIQLFKGQLIADGGLTLGGGAWKTVKFTFKGKRDELRDSVSVNGYRFIKFT